MNVKYRHQDQCPLHFRLYCLFALRILLIKQIHCTECESLLFSFLSFPFTHTWFLYSLTVSRYRLVNPILSFCNGGNAVISVFLLIRSVHFPISPLLLVRSPYPPPQTPADLAHFHRRRPRRPLSLPQRHSLGVLLTRLLFQSLPSLLLKR